MAVHPRKRGEQDWSWIGDENAALEFEGAVSFASELQYDPQFLGGFGRVELLPSIA